MENDKNKEILESKEFNEATDKLTLLLENITNALKIFDVRIKNLEKAVIFKAENKYIG